MPLLLVNKENLLHFQNLEEADFWVQMNEIDRNTIVIIPESVEEAQEIEGFLDDEIEVVQK